MEKTIKEMINYIIENGNKEQIKRMIEIAKEINKDFTKEEIKEFSKKSKI